MAESLLVSPTSQEKTTASATARWPYEDYESIYYYCATVTTEGSGDHTKAAGSDTSKKSVVSLPVRAEITFPILDEMVKGKALVAYTALDQYSGAGEVTGTKPKLGHSGLRPSQPKVAKA